MGAGRCLVTACKKNNMDIITVIIGEQIQVTLETQIQKN